MWNIFLRERGSNDEWAPFYHQGYSAKQVKEDMQKLMRAWIDFEFEMRRM